MTAISEMLSTLLHASSQRSPGPISRKVIDTVTARAFAASALVFGASTVPAALTEQPSASDAWAWVFRVGLFAALIGAAIAGAALRGVRRSAGVLALIYAAYVLMWPFVSQPAGGATVGTPWIWGLCNVATAAAVVAFSSRIAGAYIVAVAFAWASLRMTPSGGRVSLGRSVQDAGYVFILGVATMIIILALQAASDRVDRQHARARSLYQKATDDLEMEKQRNAVDALLHDSVLTTLLQASRADTDVEHRLAALMAANSIAVISDIHDPSARSDLPVTVEEIRDRLEHVQHSLGVHFTLSTSGPATHRVPRDVAETMFAATLQALTNSAQHAGPATTQRTVDATWTATEVRVAIADDGRGFDLSQPTTRLGVRLSIIERMASIRGTATIITAPGGGTQVILSWSRTPDAPTR